MQRTNTNHTYSLVSTLFAAGIFLGCSAPAPGESANTSEPAEAVGTTQQAVFGAWSDTGARPNLNNCSATRWSSGATLFYPKATGLQWWYRSDSGGATQSGTVNASYGRSAATSCCGGWMDVVWIGSSDTQLRHAWYPPSGPWNGPEVVGTAWANVPFAASSWGDGYLDVFEGNYGSPSLSHWWQSYSDGIWHVEQLSTGSEYLGIPSAAYRGSDVDIFAMNADSSPDLMRTTYNGSGLSTPTHENRALNATATAIAATRAKLNHTVVFYLDTNKAIKYHGHNYATGGYYDGTVDSTYQWDYVCAPNYYPDSNTQIDVYGIRSGKIYRKRGAPNW